MKQIKLFKAVMIFLISLYSINLCAQENSGIWLFEIENTQSGVKLRWNEKETNVAYYYEVERSINGGLFKTIGIVLGPDPACENGNNYTTNDSQVVKKRRSVAYRIKCIDQEGKVTYSQVRSLFEN